MRRSSNLFLFALFCFLPGCVLGVGWLPDSSGFVFTTPKGHVVAYDYATKKQRIILQDIAATTTAWPAVSADGKKIALVHLGNDDAKREALLQVLVCDLQGKIEFRSDPIQFARLKGKDLQYSTQVVWSPDAKKLLVHGQGLANQGDGFDNTALFDVANKQIEIWQQHVPAYFAGSPVRPDGAGFLLVNVESKDDAGDYFWVDWTGKKQRFARKRGPHPPWSALLNSRWDGKQAILTLPERRHAFDTDKLQETIDMALAAEITIGKETIQMQAKLASGVELLLLRHDDGGMSGESMRIVSRKKGDPALTEVVAPIRDRMILLNMSPGAKKAIVRVGYGYRGSKGDTIHVLNDVGQLHETIDVFHEFVKK